jgi:hypothetical protein
MSKRIRNDRRQVAAAEWSSMNRETPYDTEEGKQAPTPPPPAVLELVAFFLRNGYVRRHNFARYAAVGCMKYKKGYEVRLVANDDAELARILLLLKDSGFKSGRPYRNRKTGGQYRVPIYGREQVARFLRIVEEWGERLVAERN